MKRLARLNNQINIHIFIFQIEVLELQSRLELAQQASDLTDRLHEDLRASDARVQETFKFLLFQPRNQKKME